MTGWNPAKVWTDHRCWVVIAGKRISRIVENGKMCYNFDEFRLHWCVLHLQVFEPKESKNEETKGKKEIPPTLIRSCQQIVNGLVNSVMDLEKTNGPRLVGCITALHSFAQIRPHLLVEHAISLEPYLNIKCTSNERIKFISLLAEILEHVRSSFIDRWIAVNLFFFTGRTFNGASWWSLPLRAWSSSYDVDRDVSADCCRQLCCLPWCCY